MAELWSEDIGKPFPGTDADVFIQWKGTSLCMDLKCPCGYHGHVDAGFAYFVQCDGCGTVYQLGTQVLARKVEDGESEQPVVAFDHLAHARH